MTEELRCEFCQQCVEAVGKYVVAGGVGLMICDACYPQLVAREHQPYARLTQRLYRQLGLKPRRAPHPRRRPSSTRPRSADSQQGPNQ